MRAQHDVQFIRLPIGGVLDAGDAPHEDAWREHGGVAAGFNRLALFHLGISGKIVHIGVHHVAAVPLKVAEVTLAAHAAADARLAVRHGNNERVVPPRQVDDAHHAAAAHYAHFRADAFGCTFIYYQEAAARAARVAHHGGGNEPEVAQVLEHQAFGHGGVARHGHKCLAQGVALALQADVLFGEVAVHAFQVEVGKEAVVPAVHPRHGSIGSGVPHAALVTVETEQHRHAHQFQNQEQEHITVFSKKIEKIAHGGKGAILAPVGIIY